MDSLHSWVGILSVWLSACLSAGVRSLFCLSVGLSACQSVCLSVRLPVCRSACLSACLTA